MILAEDHTGILDAIAHYLGAPEPALRLVLSLIAGYPVAAVYRKFLSGTKETVRHIYFVVTGLCIGYFNYGEDIVHSAISVLTTYIVLNIFGGSKESVLIIFTYTMLHLLAGYYTTGTETYDIKWTMAQCVLTLRLIGLTFDIYDGSKPKEKEKQPNCWNEGCKRCALGFFYLGIHQLGSTYLPDTYLMSQLFFDQTFWRKCLIIGLWGKILLYKYICCWLISEGICISFGLTFNGKTPDGAIKWDGCQNVNLSVFENATKFGDFIASFNINTNLWVGTYIFRRLKFLGSRVISHALTLIFLAVWHGLHSGYYACFFMEFIIMQFEREVTGLLTKHKTVKDILLSRKVYPFVWVFLKLYTLVFMGYSLVPFALLSSNRWLHVYSLLYFCGHVGFLSLLILCRCARQLHI